MAPGKLDAKEQYLFKYIFSVLFPMLSFFFILGYFAHFYDSPLAFVGGAFSTIGTAKILKFLKTRFSKPPRDPASFGKWAIITGRSIGWPPLGQQSQPG